MTIEDWTILIEKGTPFLSTLAGALIALYATHIQNKRNVESEIRRLKNEREEREEIRAFDKEQSQEALINSLIASCLAFSNDARIVSNAWSTYLSYNRGGSPDAPRLREAYFEARDRLRVSMVQLVALGESYGIIKNESSSARQMGSVLDEWAAEIYDNHDSESADARYFRGKSDEIVQFLRRQKEPSASKLLQILSTSQAPTTVNENFNNVEQR